MSETSDRTRPYHHGDLRRVVLDGALQAIAEHGAAALSLRDVARRAGVSHAAPAHHFGDKAGVLTAIAAEGYELLSRRTSGALARPGATLLDCGIAGIRFALEHRAHFDVMFRPDLYRQDDPAVADAREAAMRVLVDTVRASLGPGADDEDVWAGAVAAWSFTHGFSVLASSGNLDTDPDTTIDATIRRVGRSVIDLANTGAFGAPT